MEGYGSIWIDMKKYGIVWKGIERYGRVCKCMEEKGEGKESGMNTIMYIYVIIYIQYIHMYSTICMHIYLYMPVVICTCR